MLLKANPIHLALLFFIFPILSVLMLLLGVPASSHVQLLILSVIIGWVSYLVWLWLAAKQFQQRIADQYLSLHAFFKRHFIAMIILNHLIFPVCVYWNLCSMLIASSYHYTIYIVTLVAVACVYVYLAMCYFISQMFLVSLFNRKGTISACIGTMLLFLFMIIGVWFIQPEIQKLYRRD